MLKGVKDFVGYTVYARDGDIGRINQFYFDDRKWIVRYLLINTGSWLSGREVMISPVALNQPDLLEKSFFTSLTRKKLKRFPHILENKIISHQEEVKLVKRYEWPKYWEDDEKLEVGREQASMMKIFNDSGNNLLDNRNDNKKGYLLWSTNKPIYYPILGNGGEFGSVQDFVIDTETWVIRYLVLDQKNQIIEKNVLVTTPIGIKDYNEWRGWKEENYAS
ncbi:MAG: PRC-barrel domain-containing protein [bacterium]